MKLGCFDRREQRDKNVQVMDFCRLFYPPFGFRFFSVPRSSVIKPNRISSAKGIASGRIKSKTNTSAVSASSFGKRSRDAYCISRSWIILFSLANIFYSNNREGIPVLSIKFCVIKQKNLPQGITWWRLSCWRSYPLIEKWTREL